VQWANLYFERGELNLAATRFTECLDMPTAAEQGLLVSECFEKLATIYEKQGHFEKALQNHKRYAVYRDSLFIGYLQSGGCKFFAFDKNIFEMEV